MEHEGNENRQHLLGYYTKLLAARGANLDEKQSKTLNILVNRMTESAAEDAIQEFEKSRLKRLIAYADAFYSLSKEEEEDADALLEVINATKDDSEEEIVLINGNNFRFEKGSLDINKYTDKLTEIGERTQGNTWFIYLNDDGELVIY